MRLISSVRIDLFCVCIFDIYFPKAKKLKIISLRVYPLWADTDEETSFHSFLSFSFVNGFKKNVFALLLSLSTFISSMMKILSIFISAVSFRKTKERIKRMETWTLLYVINAERRNPQKVSFFIGLTSRASSWKKLEYRMRMRSRMHEEEGTTAIAASAHTRNGMEWSSSSNSIYQSVRWEADKAGKIYILFERASVVGSNSSNIYLSSSVVNSLCKCEALNGHPSA